MSEINPKYYKECVKIYNILNNYYWDNEREYFKYRKDRSDLYIRHESHIYEALSKWEKVLNSLELL